jgi:glucose-6-phosphate isomerase
MIQFDCTNVSQDRIGLEHGLNLTKLFASNQQQIQDAVSRIYATKDEQGSWKRWLNLGEWTDLADEVTRYAEQAKGKYSDLVILGIGGSSLGGLALLKALVHPFWNNLTDEQRDGRPRYHFVDNVDADTIRGLAGILNPERTLINVITKSGTTAETMSAFMFFKNWLEAAIGADRAKTQIVATTDKVKGILRPIADREGYQTFEVPDDVGGRFSVFSAVGLLPAALCGVDVRELQRGIREMDAVLRNPDIHQNPAAQNALINVLYFQQGKPISVIMPYSARLAFVSDWYVQLWAESLGKRNDRKGNTVNVGPTPVRAVGVTDQHSQVQLFNEGPFDKVFTFVQVAQPNQDQTIPAEFTEYPDLQYLANRTFQELMTAEFESTRASLTKNRRPNVTLTLPTLDAYHFAQLLTFFMVQTAIAGELLDIDAFDQPGVELAKQYTHALMGRAGYEHLIAEARGEAVTA